MSDEPEAPNKITSLRWRLAAEPADMIAAETTVLGDYKNHWSVGEYTMDNDPDEPPEEFERTISLYPMHVPADIVRMASFWQIAAALGDKGMVSVTVETPAASIYLDSHASNLQYVRLRTSVLTEALHNRIRQAKRVLDGPGD